MIVMGLSGSGAAPAAPPRAVPPDLPLPAAPPNDAAWLRSANVLQPDGPSQFLALVNPGARPAKARKEFGFNAIIVSPTDAHNAYHHGKKIDLTDAQFRAGVAAYRAAGYRLIIYTSVMALGIAPEFQSGQIAREHPDWLQRDPNGNPVLVWGVPWLCPSTGARQAALDRAVRLAKDYQADGIMLDNNEFYFAQAGWTCHCDSCTRGFRNYVRRRFGVEKTREFFGVSPDEIKIPVEQGPLFALWIQFRNRVWAEINETYRARLREVNPRILLLANTQYLFDDAMLASDQQFTHEDVVISESVGLNSRQASAKMVLGQALAQGRPLWNYIGTFVKPDDYTGLLPAAVIGPMISSTIAHAARPWIVDGFDLGPTDANARKEMSKLLGWHTTHEELFAQPPWAGVGTVFSLTARNVLHRPLIPPHLGVLQTRGTPVIGIRDDALTAEALRPLRVLIIETAATLSDDAAKVVAAWVRAGGTLIAARDTGTFDELGRKRTESSLWPALGLDKAPDRETAIDRGKVIAPEPAAFADAAVRLTQAVSCRTPADSAIEVVAYRNANSLLLHVVRHAAAGKPVTLHLPEGFRPAAAPAELFVPGSDEPRKLALVRNSDGDSISLATADLYCVVKIAIH
jgi:hypothetical protein